MDATVAEGETPLDSVRTFVGRHVGEEPVADDDDIFATGRVNSLFAVQLVMWVERTYDIAVGPEELNVGNFNSISAVADFISHKTAARSDQTS
ncbi:methoxymalonate biosynthesis acyl carrier protein [Catenulispora sp. EB89]|uniref:phosphopantetheine-binding protein n=1 Tax=Catenulispora sp. EB89 TaxID=3156257 RepID=UPI003517FCBA